MPAELLTNNTPAPRHARTGAPARKHLKLVSDELGVECPLLPAPLIALVPRIGWTWVDPDSLLPHHRSWRKGDKIRDPGNFPCPLRELGLLSARAVLLWVDDSLYPSPRDWLADARARGPSLPIDSIPDGFTVGETWVLVAHRTAIGNAPGVIHVFQPTEVQETALPKAA